jgi:hypothetical protein
MIELLLCDNLLSPSFNYFRKEKYSCTKSMCYVSAFNLIFMKKYDVAD